MTELPAAHLRCEPRDAEEEVRAAEPRSEELLPAKSVDLTVWWRELSIIVRYSSYLLVRVGQ